MFDEPHDDWYEWRVAHSTGTSTVAGWLLAGAVLTLLLLVSYF